MNTKKARQARICECGEQFMTTAKFGNETNCHACYEARKECYLARFAKLSPAEKKRHFDIALKFLINMLATTPTAVVEENNPEQVDHADQDGVDAAFADLMQGIDL